MKSAFFSISFSFCFCKKCEMMGKQEKRREEKKNTSKGKLMIIAFIGSEAVEGVGKYFYPKFMGNLIK